MLHDDVGALVEQRFGRISFLAGIEPGVGPDDLDLDVRIDRLRPEHRGVDTRDDFGDRERCNIAEHTGLRHLGGNDALDVAAFVEPAGISRHVFGALVAGSVLEMNLGIFLRHLQRRFHVTERRREDQLVAGARQLFDRPLGVGAFADIFEVGGLDLVAEFLDECQTGEVMLVGPAEISDRAEIDEADLELVGGGRAEQAGSGGEQRGGRRNEKSFSWVSPDF